MGQRLVVTIHGLNKDLCNIYYHWSAYTMDALYETKNILECIYGAPYEDEKGLVLRLIHFCEESGGGISGAEDSFEWKYIQSIYPQENFKSDGINRNDGLIAISEHGMTESNDYAEGNVYIDLAEGKVYFNVCQWYEYFEDFLNEKEYWEDNELKDLKFEDIPNIEKNLRLFDIGDIDELIRSIQNANGYVVRDGNEIYELIA